MANNGQDTKRRIPQLKITSNKIKKLFKLNYIKLGATKHFLIGGILSVTIHG